MGRGGGLGRLGCDFRGGGWLTVALGGFGILDFTWYPSIYIQSELC
jgi:hypothetical protein